MASAFGWEKQFDVEAVDPDAVGFVDLSVGTPIDAVTVLYSAGVAWPAYRRRAEYGSELVCAAHRDESDIAKLLLGFAATMLVKSIDPQVGSFGRDFRQQCGLAPGAARHALLTPAMFWDDAIRDIFVGEFWIRPLHVALVTDEELEFFLRNGWGEFSDWMAEARVDVTKWDRVV
jgi:hypothetical protein